MNISFPFSKRAKFEGRWRWSCYLSIWSQGSVCDAAPPVAWLVGRTTGGRVLVDSLTAKLTGAEKNSGWLRLLVDSWWFLAASNWFEAITWRNLKNSAITWSIEEHWGAAASPTWKCDDCFTLLGTTGKHQTIASKSHWVVTLRSTNISSEKRWFRGYFPFWRPIFTS